MNMRNNIEDKRHLCVTDNSSKQLDLSKITEKDLFKR